MASLLCTSCPHIPFVSVFQSVLLYERLNSPDGEGDEERQMVRQDAVRQKAGIRWRHVKRVACAQEPK